MEEILERRNKFSCIYSAGAGRRPGKLYFCKYMEKEGGTNITAFYGAGARRKLNHAAFVISALQSSKGHIIIYIEQEDVNFDGKPFVDS